MKNLMVSIAILSACGLANADSYFGINYKPVDAEVQVDFGFGSVSLEPTIVEGRYGSMITNNFAVEGRLGLGMSDDQGLDVDTLYGIYGAYHFTPDASFSPYAFIGYTNIELSAGGQSDDDSDASFGFGADITINPTTAFNVEYVQYGDIIGVELSSLGVGVTFKF